MPTVQNQVARKNLIAMYCAFGDESRDGTGKRVYAVSGVFGSESDWGAIRKQWTAKLGGRMFHAKDCERCGGDFADLSPAQSRKLYRSLVEVIVSSHLVAHAGAIDVKEYKQVFPREFEHAPYLWLFGDIILEMARLAYFSIPKGRVEVTFDRNDVEYNAGLLYDFIRRSKDQALVTLLSDKISFATNKTLEIQVADLVAREAMKRLDAEVTKSKRPMRASFTLLVDSRRLFFRSLRKKDFEEKKRILKSSPMRNEGSLARYDEWVKRNGLQDCLSNRLRYIEANSEAIGLRPKDGTT
jgi:hypothetical protein